MDTKYALDSVAKCSVLSGQGNYNEAIKACDEAIELNSDLAEAWHGKGRALESLGRNAEDQEAHVKAKELGYAGGLNAASFGAKCDERGWSLGLFLCDKEISANWKPKVH